MFPSLLVAGIALVLNIAAPRALFAQRQGADSLLRRAAALYAEGSYTEVVGMLSMITPDSLSAPEVFYLGTSYAALGDFRNSTRYLRASVSLAASHNGYRFQLARVLAQGGLVQDAKAQFEILLAGETPFLPAFINYGILLYEDGDYRGAAAAFEQSILLNPRDYTACYYLGSCLDRLGLPDSAMTYLAASLTLNPAYTPAGRLLASLYYARKDYQQSLLLYERLCKQRPRNPDYWYKAGLCSERLGSDQLAMDLFRHAAALDSTEALYPAHIGQIFFGHRSFDSSAAAYRQAVSLDAGNPVLLLNLGLSFARMDSTGPAIDAFTRSAAAHQVEKAAVAYIQLATVYYNARRYRKARTAYARALMLDPSNLEALFFIGFTLEQLGARDAARTAFTKYLQAAENEPSLEKRIAMVKERLQKLTRAQ